MNSKEWQEIWMKRTVLLHFVKELPAKSPATIVGVGDDYVVLKITPIEGRDYAVIIPVACFVLKVPY